MLFTEILGYTYYLYVFPGSLFYFDIWFLLIYI